MQRACSYPTQMAPVGLEGDDPTWIPGGSSETCLETLDEGSKVYFASRIFALLEGSRSSEVLFTET